MSTRQRPRDRLAEATERLSAAYRARRAPDDPAWLASLREAGIGRFAAAGIPGPRVEEWKFTNLTPLARAELSEPAEAPAPGPGDLAPALIEGARRLVFVDGRFAPALSETGEEEGVAAGSVAAALAEEPDSLRPLLEAAEGGDAAPLADLNTAFLADGAVVRAAPGARAARPIQIVYVTTGAAASLTHPRTLVLAGAGAALSLVEAYAGLGPAGYWTNAVTELRAEPGARLRWVRLQEEGEGAWHTGLARVHLAREAAFDGLVVSTGAALARNEVRVALDGEGADCTLNAVTLPRGRQHADVTTLMDHRVPRGTSRQSFRSVVDDAGHAVHQGRVVVAEGAAKTDARQMSRSLLLSPEAEADAKPELRIFADDVQCSHGATVSDLDADQLFYLTSRGIGREAARALLIEAFVAEIFDAVGDEAVKAHLRAGLARRLGSESLS